MCLVPIVSVPFVANWRQSKGTKGNLSLIVRNYTENTDLADQKEELSNKQRQKKHVCLIVPRLDFCLPIPSHRSHVPLCQISIVFKKNLSACLSGVTHHGTDAYLCGGK